MCAIFVSWMDEWIGLTKEAALSRADAGRKMDCKTMDYLPTTGKIEGETSKKKLKDDVYSHKKNGWSHESMWRNTGIKGKKDWYKDQHRTAWHIDR